MANIFKNHSFAGNAGKQQDQRPRITSSITPITHLPIGQKDDNKPNLFLQNSSSNWSNQQTTSSNREQLNDSFNWRNPITLKHGQIDQPYKSGSQNISGMIPPSHTHKDQNRIGGYFGNHNQTSALNEKNSSSLADIFSNKTKQQSDSQKPSSLWDKPQDQNKDRTSTMWEKNQSPWNKQPKNYMQENQQQPTQGQISILFGSGKKVKTNESNSSQINIFQQGQGVKEENKIQWNQTSSLQQQGNQLQNFENQIHLQQQQNLVTQQQLGQQVISNFGLGVQYDINNQNQMNQPNLQNQFGNQNQITTLFNNTNDTQQNNLIQQPNQNQSKGLFNHILGTQQTQISQQIQENNQGQSKLVKKSGKQENNSKQSKAQVDGIVNMQEPPQVFKIDIDVPQPTSFQSIPICPKQFAIQNHDVLRGYYQTQKERILEQDEIEQAQIINQQRIRQERELRYKQYTYEPLEQQNPCERFNHRNYDQRRFRIRKAQEPEEDEQQVKNRQIRVEKNVQSQLCPPVRQEQYTVDIEIQLLESNQQYKLINFTILANVSVFEIKQQIIRILGQQNLFVTAKIDAYCQTSQLLSYSGQAYQQNDRLNKYSIRQGLILEIFLNPSQTNNAKNFRISPQSSQLLQNNFNDLLMIDNLEVEMENGSRIKWLEKVDFSFVDLDEVLSGNQLYDISRVGLLRVPKYGEKLNTRRLVSQKIPVQIIEDLKYEQNMLHQALEAWAVRETQLLGYQFQCYDSDQMKYEYIIGN